jgi:hypothetical protein
MSSYGEGDARTSDHANHHRRTTSRAYGSNDHLQYLPPHLREVCDLLARGLVRLRSRTSDDIARDLGVHGESSLHSLADPSGHADSTTRCPT